MKQTFEAIGSIFAFQSPECDVIAERTNLNRPNTVSDITILSPYRSNDADRRPLLKTVFVQLHCFKNDFVISTKIISEHFRGWRIQ